MSVRERAQTLSQGHHSKIWCRQGWPAGEAGAPAHAHTHTHRLHLQHGWANSHVGLSHHSWEKNHAFLTGIPAVRRTLLDAPQAPSNSCWVRERMTCSPFLPWRRHSHWRTNHSFLCPALMSPLGLLGGARRDRFSPRLRPYSFSLKNIC